MKREETYCNMSTNDELFFSQNLATAAEYKSLEWAPGRRSYGSKNEGVGQTCYPHLYSQYFNLFPLFKAVF